MIDFFVRPWEISNNGNWIEQDDGTFKSREELRQSLYENVIDQVVFISRASEGALSPEWIMSQPVFIRRKYVEFFKKEVKERQERMNKTASK